MKLPYENELYELRKWIDFTSANLQMQFLHTPQEIQRVHQWINAVTRGIQADYPFYATTLPCVANILFQQNEMGAIFLNPAAFGELVVIVRHIEAEPVVVQFWAEIHPRIVNVSVWLPASCVGGDLVGSFRPCLIERKCIFDFVINCTEKYIFQLFSLITFISRKSTYFTIVVKKFPYRSLLCYPRATFGTT